MLFPRSPAVRINVEGARIVEDDITPQTGRDIQFPHHDETISHIAVDIGGSLAKVVYFKRDADSGVRLNFTRFETTDLADLIRFLGVLIEKRRTIRRESPNDKKDDICIMATGGGAYKFYKRIKAELGVDIHKKDEMKCLIVGLDFFINEIPGEVFTYGDEQTPMIPCDDPIEYPYLLVNIGSGVSMIKVSGPDDFVRIGGSSLGGGTFWGVLSFVTGAKSFDEMLDYCSHGDNTKVDLLVGDIYGSGYEEIGLKANTIASTFGKVFSLQKQRQVQAKRHSGIRDGPEDHQPSRNGYTTPESMDSAGHRTDLSALNDNEAAIFASEDSSRSLLYGISNNIGQITVLQAMVHGVQNVYFGGSFIRGHSQTMATLSYAMNYWSTEINVPKKAYFLRHEGYLGAIGAFLLHQPTWATWSRRSSMEHNESPDMKRSVPKSQKVRDVSDKTDDTTNESAVV